MQSALVCDYPHVLTCIEVPGVCVQELLCGELGVVELDYKDLFKRLTGRKRHTSARIQLQHLQSTSSSVSTSASAEGIPTTPTRPNPLPRSSAPKTRLDTIIDQLERKYLAMSNFQNSPGDFSECTSNASACSSASASPEVVKSSSSKKRSSAANDYDYDDAFIDDSEAIEKWRTAADRKRMRTVVNGFFVSSGDLEVVYEKKQSSAGVKASLPASQSTVDSTAVSARKSKDDSFADDPDEIVLFVQPKSDNKKEKSKSKKEPKPVVTVADESATDTKPKEKPKKERKPKEDTDKKLSAVPAAAVTATAAAAASVVNGIGINAQALAESTISSSVDKAAVDGATVVEAPLSSPVIQKKEKPEKEDWHPPAEVLLAMEQFKQTVEASEWFQSGASKKANHMPVALEAALHSLDEVVHTHFSAKQLHRTKGYLETVALVFDQSLGVHRLKSILSRLHCEKHVKELQTQYEQRKDVLTMALIQAVGPCPEHRQPGHKPQKRVKPITGELINSSGQENAIEVPVVDLDGTADNTSDGFALLDSQMDSYKSAESAVAADEGVTQSTMSGVHGNDPGPGVSESSTAAHTTPTSTPTPRFEFICKWTAPLKAQLIELDDSRTTYMTESNKCREKLLISERKERSDHDCAPWDLEVELDNMCKHLSVALPISCLQGDAPYIVRIIKTERQRAKRQSMTTAAAGPPANGTLVPTVLPSVVPSAEDVTNAEKDSIKELAQKKKKKTVAV